MAGPRVDITVAGARLRFDTKFYGRVRKASGIGYVATRFTRAGGVPFMPMDSWYLREGCEGRGDAPPDAIPFAGGGLDMRSVGVVYLRMFLIALALFCASRLVFGAVSGTFFPETTIVLVVCVGLVFVSIVRTKASPEQAKHLREVLERGADVEKYDLTAYAPDDLDDSWADEDDVSVGD